MDSLLKLCFTAKSPDFDLWFTNLFLFPLRFSLTAGVHPEEDPAPFGVFLLLFGLVEADEAPEIKLFEDVFFFIPPPLFDFFVFKNTDELLLPPNC